jgi:8-oxo-dGTP diphosphatase
MDRPFLGTAVIVERNNKPFPFQPGHEILLHKRKPDYTGGAWGFPGGHLEFGETFEQSARREAKEEADLEIVEFNFVAVTNQVYPPEINKHYVTFFLQGKYQGEEPQVMEPDKNEGWEWFTFPNLPSPLMPGIVKLIGGDYYA